MTKPTRKKLVRLASQKIPFIAVQLYFWLTYSRTERKPALCLDKKNKRHIKESRRHLIPYSIAECCKT